MSVITLEALHADLKKNIGKPASIMRDKFSDVNDMLKYVTPYLLTAGKIPLPRLKTDRVLNHNRGANKDTFIETPNAVQLSERWLEAQEGKLEFSLKESEIMALYNSYLFRLSGKSESEVVDYMTKFPFEDEIYNAIAARAYKDLRDDSWMGVIGETSASPINGYLKKIVDAMGSEIPDTNYASTATFTESNIVGELKKVFAKVAGFSYALKMDLQIHTSPSNIWLYNNYKTTVKEDYKPIINNGLQSPNELVNGVFVPEEGLEGTNAVVITAKQNLAFGMNTLPGSINFRTQLNDYTIKVMAKVVFDANFQDGRFLWCNDDLLPA